jgi:protein subunit release factor B
MQKLGLDEQDLQESFVLSGGSGGQKVNKTASAVQLIHPPSGQVVKCAEARSQHLNRLRARERLCELVEEKRAEEKRQRDARRARIRYQKRKPSARAKANRVQVKRKHSEVKRLRGRPGRDE